VINADYELLALAPRLSAAKALSRWPGLSSPSLEGGSPEIAEPTQFGGTRQLSAAQFVHDQRDAIALVASQDGRFTVFAWSQSEELVHAHRIDALLHAATFSNQYSCAVHPARLCDALGGPAEGDVDARSEAVQATAGMPGPRLI
jgi:hypothetical protein